MRLASLDTLLMSTCALAAVIALPAQAQDLAGAAQATATADAEDLPPSEGDIVVSARKRDERLIDVPVVVTVQNAETLARYNARDLTSIGELTPSVIVSAQRGQGGGSIAVRGISSPSNQLGFEQAVSVAVDGVQTSNGHIAQLGFFDLQQVEVLKGPQALFFGKNNTGGVISITTAGGTDSLEVSGRLAYEFVGDEVTAETAVSGPLSDTLKGRVAVQYRYLDGWLRNTAKPIANPFYVASTGAPAGAAQLPGTSDPRPGENELLGRLTLDFKPSSTFSAVLKVFGGHEKDSGPGVVAQNIGPCTGPFPRMYGVADPNGDCMADNRTTIADLPQAIASTISVVKTDGHARGELKAFASSLNMKLDLGSFSLASVTGYNYTSYNSFTGFDQTSYSQLVVAEKNSQDEFSQELRLNSDFSGPFNFMVGGYYQRTVYNLDTENILNDNAYVASANKFSSVVSTAHQSGNSLSVFGQARYNIDDTFEIAAGLRWTRETKRFKKRNLYGTGALNSGGVSFPGSDEIGVLKGYFRDTNVSPEVTLTWHVNPNVTLFGAYKTGFKAGGFGLNSQVQTTTRIGDTDFDSEKAKGFEIGARGRLLDNKLYFSAAAFAYDFKNLQVNVFVPERIAYIINNAGKLRQRGFELELSYDVSPQLNIHGAMAYVHNRFSNYTGQCYGYLFPTGTVRATAVPPPNCSFVNTTSLTLQQVFDGRAPGRSPDFTGNAGFILDVPVGASHHFGLTGDAYYSDPYYAADTLVVSSRQPSFWRFNASASIGAEDDRWKLSLIGRNLTNKYFLLYAADRTGGASVPGAIGEQRGVVSRGREVIAQATFKF